MIKTRIFSTEICLNVGILGFDIKVFVAFLLANSVICALMLSKE
jgi:hypothetical protein